MTIEGRACSVFSVYRKALRDKCVMMSPVDDRLISFCEASAEARSNLKRLVSGKKSI